VIGIGARPHPAPRNASGPADARSSAGSTGTSSPSGCRPGRAKKGARGGDRLSRGPKKPAGAAPGWVHFRAVRGSKAQHRKHVLKATAFPKDHAVRPAEVVENKRSPRLRQGPRACSATSAVIPVASRSRTAGSWGRGETASHSAPATTRTEIRSRSWSSLSTSSSAASFSTSSPRASSASDSLDSVDSGPGRLGTRADTPVQDDFELPPSTSRPPVRLAGGATS